MITRYRLGGSHIDTVTLGPFFNGISVRSTIYTSRGLSAIPCIVASFNNC